MKIVIAGNYGAGNIGDEMILKGLLDVIKSISSDVDITVLSGNPEETKMLHNVASDKKFPSGVNSLISAVFDRKSKTRKIVKECDYFILGGGGLFAGPKKRANIIWGVQALMAHIYKKPIIIYGQSVGETSSYFEKWIIKKVFEKANFIALRDEKSAERIKNIGINKEIHVIPDMAFALDEKIINIEKKEIAIVSLRQIENITRKLKVSISEFIDWLTVEKRYVVKIINFQQGAESDALISKSTIRLIEHMENVEYIERITDKEILEIFSEAKFILGMRFHSIVYAIKTVTPFIAISYAVKIKDLLTDAGLNKYMLDIGEVTLDSLKKHFEDVISSYKDIQNLEQKYNENALKKHHEMRAVLSKILL